MAKSRPSKPESKKQQPAPLEGNERWRERGRVRKAGPVQQEKTLWEKLPTWAQHAICLTLLLVVALSFFAPVVFGGRTLVGGDTMQWRGAAEAMQDYEEATGNPALWAPNVFSGMPGFLIDYPPAVPGVDTPLMALRAAGLWPLAHFLALLVGTYLLVHTLTRSKWAGTLSAVAYGLTTYLPLILTAGHNTKFIALAYAPWLLLGFAYVIERPDDAGWRRTGFAACLFAIATALNLRAGHVQITYYLAWLLLVWWLVEGVAAVRSGRTKAWLLSTGALALGGVLGVLAVANPYWAQAEYKAFTIRSAGPGGGLDWDYAMAWSQGVGELLTLLVADAWGGTSPTYWGGKPFTAGPHYVGPIVLALAVLGLVGVRRRVVVAFALAAALMTLFALGEHFGVLSRLMFAVAPLFSSFRVPETWLIVVALALAVLAGYGLYYLVRREATPEAEARKSRLVYITLGSVAGVLALLWVLGPSILPLGRPDEAAGIAQQIAQGNGVDASDPRVGPAAQQAVAELRTQRADMLRGDAGRGLLFLALAAALVWALRTRKLPPWAVQIGLVLLVTVDLWGVGRRYFNEENPALQRTRARGVERTAADDWLVEAVQREGGPGRFRVLSLDRDPTTDGRPAYFYESVGGNHAAKLAVYQDYLDRLLFTADGTGVTANGLDLMSARYVVANGVLPGTTPVFQDPATGLLVLENADALPRAFFVDSVEVIADGQNTLARLRDDAFDPRRVAILERPLPADFRLSAPDTSATAVPDSVAVPAIADAVPADSLAADSTLAAEIAAADTLAEGVALARFNPREIVWRVRADRPRLLVVSEVYYPAGWTATVDGRETPILRANHLQRAVAVPPGDHLVAMRFEPTRHRQGVLVSTLASALMYLGALALGGLLWYRRGHPRA